MAEKDSKKENIQRQETPALEWLAAVIGFVLVVSTIGYLIYSAVTQGDSPPNLMITNYTISKSGNSYLVQFTLSNTGENNAAEITVEGKITEGEKDLETSAVTIDYAPAHSTREGGLLFKNEPIKDKNFEIRAVGYKKP